MGKFLHIFLAGWDDRECARAFEVLAGSSRFIKQLQVVTACKHGLLLWFIYDFEFVIYIKYCFSSYVLLISTMFS